MGSIERFTRDAVSKYVWSILALLAAIGLVYAVAAGGEAVEAERLEAQDRAMAYAEQVVSPRIEGVDLSVPLSADLDQRLGTAVERSILVDQRVERVRVWSVDGLLLFSSDPTDRIGSRTGLTDTLLRESVRDGTQTLTDVSDTGGDDDPERSLLRTYIPVGQRAAIEVDQTGAGTLGPAREEWLRYQVVAGAALVLFLILTGLSLRDPIEPINVGVPFAATSIPAGYALIDDDRLDAVEEVYRLASERVARLQERLDASEEGRRRLEAKVQQSLSRESSNAKKKPRPATAPPVPDTAPPVDPVDATRTAAEIVQVPESEIVTSPEGVRRSAAPAGPLARAARDQKPYQPNAGRAKPVSAKAKKKQPKKRVPKARRDATKPKRVVAEPTTATEHSPASEPVPTTEPLPAHSAPAPPTPQRAPAEPTPRPALTRKAKAMAVASREQAWSAPAPSDPDLEDARAHEAALETFIRLTESDRQHRVEEVDQGAVRAALARTAARKKPGGERLHRPQADSPRERSGGPPPARG